MNRHIIGLNFEKKAIEILKKEGYKLIDHTSKTKDFAPYDLIVKKGKNMFFVEVKGRSGKSKDFHIHRRQLLAYIYTSNVLVMLINDFEHRLLRFEDLEKRRLLKGFHLYLGHDLPTLLSMKKVIREEITMGEERENRISRNGTKKRLYRLGDKLFCFFAKDQQNCYGMKEGYILNISDIIVEKPRKKEK